MVADYVVAQPVRARYRQAVEQSRQRIQEKQIPDEELVQVVAEQHGDGRWTGECPWCDGKRHVFPGLDRQALRCRSTLSPLEVLVVDEWEAIFEEKA